MRTQSHVPTVRKARGYLILGGAVLLAASLACSGAVPPTVAPPATATSPQVNVATAVAVTDTPLALPTVAVPTPTATMPVSVNNGTVTPSPVGTLETDCGNVYQPAVEGATWSYSGSVVGKDVNKTWTEVDTITDVGTTAFLREVKLPNKTIVDTWKCTPQGLVALLPDGGLFAAVAQGPSGSVTVKTTAATGLTLPLSVNPGDAWQQHSVLEISDQKSTTVSGELSIQFHAVGPEHVTVPAGDFNAERVDVHAEFLVHAGQGVLTTFDGSQWMVPELGIVKRSGSLTLAQGSSPSQLDFELVSAHIP